MKPSSLLALNLLIWIQNCSALSEWARPPSLPDLYALKRRRWLLKAHNGYAAMVSGDDTRAVEQCSRETIHHVTENGQLPGTSSGHRRLPSTHAANNSTADAYDVALVSRVKMWPPWPFSLLTQGEGGSESDKSGFSSMYPSNAALFWAYFKQKTRVSLRQCQLVGSQLWFHLPPAAPPIILLASIPRRIATDNPEGADMLIKRFIPLFVNPFARNLALGGLGMAIMSWAHMEVNRKQVLTPIPGIPHRSISEVFLPPYLPEDVPEPEIEALQSIEETKQRDLIDNNDSGKQSRALRSPRIKKQLAQLYDKSPSPRTLHSTIQRRRRLRSTRKRETAKIQRLSIFDELVALQALKRRSERRRKRSGVSVDDEEDTPNYALVTGASQGIGRAIAVELARWEIPLILVARDIDRLTSLAYDLEACYGVRCCILQADLSEPDAAEKIYDTTSKAGICVDILINNAGVGHEGDAVDMTTREIDQMVTVNMLSYAKLAQLYGKDMKKQRRGRILMLSSMAGLASAAPNCALYGATKAFGKSLSLALGKEMEPYGVGVTCLLPGPVKTQFSTRSNTADALCWRVPFYVKQSRSVAHIGVMALLDGDSQVIPGWQNRAFSKIFRPVIPQRVEIMAVKAAFSPFDFPLPKFLRRNVASDNGEGTEEEFISPATPNLQPRYTFQRAPLLLKLKKEEEEVLKPKQIDPTPGLDESSPESNETVITDVAAPDEEAAPNEEPEPETIPNITPVESTDSHQRSDVVPDNNNTAEENNSGKDDGDEVLEESTTGSFREAQPEKTDSEKIQLLPPSTRPDKNRAKKNDSFGPTLGGADEFEFLEFSIDRGMPRWNSYN